MEFRTQDLGDSRIIHAYQDGKPVGAVTLVGDRLDEIWIRPELRGQGFGRPMTEEAIALGARVASVVSPVQKRILEKLGWKSHDGLRWTSTT